MESVGVDVATSTMEPHELTDAIEDVLSEFSEVDRDIVVMRLVGQLSVREIAAFTGVSKSQVDRKLPALQERLADAFRNHPAITEYVHGSG